MLLIFHLNWLKLRNKFILNTCNTFSEYSHTVLLFCYSIQACSYLKGHSFLSGWWISSGAWGGVQTGLLIEEQEHFHISNSTSGETGKVDNETLPSEISSDKIWLSLYEDL